MIYKYKYIYIYVFYILFIIIFYVFLLITTCLKTYHTFKTITVKIDI